MNIVLIIREKNGLQEPPIGFIISQRTIGTWLDLFVVWK